MKAQPHQSLGRGPLATEIKRRIADVPIDAGMKGLPAAPHGSTLGDVGSFGWSLGAGDLLTPVAVIARSAIEHNAKLMSDYCARQAVSLAPHGKTTMAPQLIDLQLAHGAWAITAATVAQTRLFFEFGVERVLLANEVTDLAGLREVGRLLRADESRQVLILVDSVRGVEQMDDVFSKISLPRAVDVLVELGIPEGRTGARNADRILDVARAVDRAESLLLAGVEGYEGVLGSDDDASRAIDSYLDEMVTASRRLATEGLLDDIAEPILSAGGSAFFDRVVERFAAADARFRTVLRSGCYIAHDNGKYMRSSPLDGRSRGGPRLRPALEVWTSVVSTPEPGLIVLNAGRRDLSFDAGLPVVVKVLRQGDKDAVKITQGFEVVRMMDQHSVVRTDEAVTLDEGDLVALGVSHPCTTFDKWRVILVVDDDGAVVDALMTFF